MMASLDSKLTKDIQILILKDKVTASIALP
jgi:hypothetical protein